ncbi:MAG: DEAD/DEAH box helicase family protein [Candidatus Pacebacteria bacterium]|nr:DEAD/DEAH box helicase family protein [Candidatus Paceibacterota bacterium]
MLYEEIKNKAFDLRIQKPETPSYILENIKYDLFDWQEKALENFLTYQEIRKKEEQSSPTHLMFNMATGTGKTLLMASLILYYYKQGYKQFIFFVNQNNIVDKTENNFIDNTHTKYLYKDKIVIDNKTINVKKVETFSDNPQGIEIKFTTIQQLYNDIHIERENKTTLDDLNKKNIVMLADEAHHLNADTKKKKGENLEFDFCEELKNNASKNEVERKGWEHTVINLILNKNGREENNKNVLLEFTATIPNNQEIQEKYKNKIIYKFGLKEFLSAGYTKEINLISSTLEKDERVIQALLFHWYRHKIALKNNISNFKPIILFRSKTIEESKNDYNEFVKLIKNLNPNNFNFINHIDDKIYESEKPSLFEMGKSRTEQVIKFIKNNKIYHSEIIDFLKDNFQERNIIITNSKDNKTKTEKTTQEQEKLLNNLEDKNNHIRAIFTVDRLTEGWDVLNLFDIVRLYQGQNAGGSTRSTPEATIKEKQLIGRGVRYFPFSYKDKEKNKRKFDNDLDNELRVLEELYYYTYDEESRYISHLKAELKKDGYISDNKIPKNFNLKEKFKNGNFYKTVKIWQNKAIDNPNRQKNTLEDIQKDFLLEYKINSFELSEQNVNLQNQNDIERLNIQEDEGETKNLKIKDIEKHIFRKAINIKAKEEDSFFQFENLRKELKIKSIEDLQKENFFGNFEIKITHYEKLSEEEKLKISLKFLKEISNRLKDYISPKIGSEFTQKEFKEIFSKPKTKIIEENSNCERITNELKNKDWYVLEPFYGTSEEEKIIDFIKDNIKNIEDKYEEYYLLRNEEVYKIYDFKKGRGFQPDFILFLKNNDNLYYQIFIEPKGEHLMEFDKWKEEFLLEISEKYGNNKLLKAENKDYRLIGLPFFNSNNKERFDNEFNQLL